SIDNLCRLLIFAYVIDLPHEFLDISWKLFLYHKGPFSGPYTQAVMLVEHPLLRQDITRMAAVCISIKLKLTSHRGTGYEEVQMLPVISSGHYGSYESELAYADEKL